MKGINEFYELTSITRKRLQTPSVHVNIHLEQAGIGRKGEDHDRYGIRTSDHRGSCKKTQDFKIHCDQTYSRWKVGIHQNWQSLQSQPRGSGKLHRRADSERRQKIKPPTWWRWTINNFTAVRFLSGAWKTKDKNHRCTLLIISIVCCPRTSQWLCKAEYTNRKVYL